MTTMWRRLAGLCLAACLTGPWTGLPAAAAEPGPVLTAAPPLPATALELGGAVGSYSDAVVLQARLLGAGAPLAGQPVAFSIGGMAVGTAETDGGGVAAITWTADLAAGTYAMTARFAGGPGLLASRADAALQVLPETAFLIYDGARLVTGGPLTIRVRVAPEDDGTPGDLAHAGQVRVLVTRAGGGAPRADMALAAGPDGWAEAALHLPEASYDVALSLSGGDYAARPLALRLPSRADFGRSLMVRLGVLAADVATADVQTAPALAVHLDVAQRKLQSAIGQMDGGGWTAAGHDLDVAAQQLAVFIDYAGLQGLRQGLGERAAGWQFTAYTIVADMRWLRSFTGPP